MILDNVITISKAEPDSHYRLRPCEECGSDNVAYVLRNDNGNEAWGVECFDCGNTGTQNPTRHGAQVLWNRTVLGVAV